MPIRTSPADGTTASLARDLVRSVARDRRQAAVSLLALAAGAAVAGPWGALAAATLGGGLIAVRRSLADRAGAGEAAAGFRLRLATARNGKAIEIDPARDKGNVLVLGTTGSGKTEALLGIAEESISKGGGVVFCDGKGDVSLFGKVFALAFKHGREDDLLALNMMVANPEQRRNGAPLTNTFNPFATEGAEELAQMLVSLLEQGGDGGMWKVRGMALMQGLMRMLVWLRDDGRIDLDAGTVARHLALSEIVRIGNGESHASAPLELRHLLRAYLASLPGYNEERGLRQAQTTLNQHGYLEMQFSRILGALSEVYGHVFSGSLADVDMDDVVANRRILVVILPALEKSSDELANLGKIVVANLKGALAKSRESLEVGNVPPPLCILDEVGYYAVEGLATASTRARDRYGAVTMFCTQDIPSMMRHDEREGAAILAQSGTKIVMRVEGENPDFMPTAREQTKDLQPGEMIVLQGEGPVQGTGGFVSIPRGFFKDAGRLRLNHLVRLQDGRPPAAGRGVPA